MAIPAEAVDTDRDPPRYARFSRRLRGIAIDFMLFLGATVVALQVAVAIGSSQIAQVIGFSFLAGFFLYEPLLVSLTGGTVGHHLSNLRVVDDRTHGNIGLPKAVARVAIKAVLSWYSFLSMAAARRHQAVHDLLTRSTVQIRDPAKAAPGHYSRARVEPASPGMPSRARRAVVILLYLAAVYLLVGGALGGLMVAGLLSGACFNHHRCSGSEALLQAAAGVSLLVLWALCIGRGWQGRLWGARRRAMAG